MRNTVSPLDTLLGEVCYIQEWYLFSTQKLCITSILKLTIQINM